MIPKLAEVIVSLIWHKTKAHKRLRGNLYLAYTPAELNTEEPGEYRLCLSRKGNVRPSEAEDRLVYQALLSALKTSNRKHEPVQLMPNMTIPTQSGRVANVTLIVWREPVQEGFPFERKTEE